MVYYGIKNCCKLAFYNKSTGALAAYFPFGNTLTVSITGDNVEAMANGSAIINWASNRKATAKLDTQTISPKLLMIVLGATNSTLASGTMVQFENGIIASATPTFTLAENVSTGTLSVFLTEADGATVISELTAIGSNPDATQYSIAGKIITVNAANASKNILCIYAKDGVNIDQITIKANEFSAPYRICGLGVVRGVDSIDRLQEINIPSATAQSNAEFTYSADSPSSFSFTFDLSADPITQELVSFKSL